MKKKVLSLGLIAILATIDQLIKQWALGSLLPMRQIEVVKGLFNLTYIENRGAAFGIFQDKTNILTVISGALLLVLIVALMLDKFKPDFIFWTVSIGIAGGIGNLYDRIVRGFVVDYLDFSALFGFPVFNMADCCVVVATFLVLIYMIKTDSKNPSAKETL